MEDSILSTFDDEDNFEANRPNTICPSPTNCMRFNEMVSEDDDNNVDVPNEESIDALANGFAVTLRKLQKECIMKLLQRESVLLVLPTGAGKSMTYQMYALAKKSIGIIIYIAPLNSILCQQYRKSSEMKVSFLLLCNIYY